MRAASLAAQASSRTSESAVDGKAVDVSEVNDELSGRTTRGIFIGIGGDIEVRFQSGNKVVLTNVPDGTLLPLAVAAILTAATTASDIVALF